MYAARNLGFSLLAVLMLTAQSARSEGPPAAEAIQDSVNRGISFLKATQSDNGTWTSPTSLGVTGLATYALLINGVPADDPAVALSLKTIEAHIQPDGGIYHPESTLKNYETAIVLQALIAANSDGRYDNVIPKALNFVKELQWDDPETTGVEDYAFGGAGYGRHARPDLSNTAFFLEALHTAGVPSNDPAMQNALIFISRCQNLKSEHNDTQFADKIEDGGFYYTPAAGGNSPAGNTPEGGLRSYASMTYAGLKSMIYAGLTEDDPRVQAAQQWLQRFYTLEENPGMGQQGLFYYYLTAAKTFEALGKKEFTDANGVAHDWKLELAAELIKRQEPNGSWVNANERWMEGDPNLVSAYALVTMSHTRESAKTDSAGE